MLYVKQTLFNSSKTKHIVLKRSVVTGVMGSRYERYIFHMYTMKIVAKLINFKQIQPSKKTNFSKKYYNTKIKILNMKTTGSVRVYNCYRVFCEIASLNNFIIIHYL